MKYTQFDKRLNTLYINSNVILPNVRGLGYKEHGEMLGKAFTMSYIERIEAYASEEAKAEIYKEMKKHEGCKISEFCNAF